MQYSVGDCVVYRKPKRSTRPGRRATDVHPAPCGDDYSYVVPKYWVVRDVLGEHTIEVCTRRGKRHRLRVNDPRLRKANLLEGIFLRRRFPHPEEATTGGEEHE